LVMNPMLASVMAASTPVLLKLGFDSASDFNPCCTLMFYADITLGDPCITMVQVLSPTLPKFLPSANTVLDPPINGAWCTQHFGPHGRLCGVLRCPTQLSGFPLANTDFTPCIRLGGLQ